jgi:methylmalonyl-CoA epimerase
MNEPESYCMVKHIDHVGIAVSDLESALNTYCKLLDSPLTPLIEAPELGLRAAIIAQGQTRIELLEPTNPNSPLGKFLESKGEGLHHIAFEVDDITAKLEQLKNSGIPLVDEKPRRGLTGMIAFLKPEAVHNVLVELVQTKADSEVPS